jgi:hypothetical protein
VTRLSSLLKARSGIFIHILGVTHRQSSLGISSEPVQCTEGCKLHKANAVLCTPLHRLLERNRSPRSDMMLTLSSSLALCLALLSLAQKVPKLWKNGNSGLDKIEISGRDEIEIFTWIDLKAESCKNCDCDGRVHASVISAKTLDAKADNRISTFAKSAHFQVPRTAQAVGSFHSQETGKSI